MGGIQRKRHFLPNGALSHDFVIVNGKIVTAKRYSQNGTFISDSPHLYNFKIQNMTYLFWNQADLKDTVEIIDDSFA